MNFRARFYKPVLAMLAAALFCASSQMQGMLNKDRRDYGFTRQTVLSNAPPILAFTTVALGGFRGLISNFLWMRASELQEEERYFEMVQLSDWITTLEPHFTDVWTIQAWNMAYNISVKCKDFEERWKWVQRGLALLHKGLKENPGEVNMYRELSWFFRHKIGQNLDDAHKLYKLRWAQQMQGVLGGHPDFDALINPRTPEDRRRADLLRDEYDMDPKFIQEIDTNYGPLDWRLPEAHAIYWGEMGVRNGTQTDKDLIRRNSYAIMRQVCLTGGALPTWVTNVTPDDFILWPNLDLVPKAVASFEDVKLSISNKAAMESGEKNFLKEAVVLLYEYNRTREAAHWFDYLKANFTNALHADEANLTVEGFAFKQIQSDISEEDPKKAKAFILGLTMQRYLCLIAGDSEDDDRAERFRQMAAFVWQTYEKNLPPGPDPNKARLRLLPLAQMEADELEDLERQLSPQAGAILRNRLGLPPRAPAAAPPNPTPPSGA
jgi:hypothetical protein